MVFCGLVGAVYGLSYVLEPQGPGRLWVLALLLQPAIIARRWFFEIPGAELEYHYYGAIGLSDYLGLVAFYFLVCLALAWCWARVRAGGFRT